MPANIINLTPAQIAAWPKPNYIDPDHRSWMPGFGIFLLSIATVLTAGRFWIRFTGQAGTLGIDDAFLLVGWIASVLFTTAVLLVTERYYANRHAWDVPPTSYVGLVHSLWLAEQAFLVSGCFTKISVLLFYRRLVQGTYDRRWMYAVLIAAGFIAVWTLPTCLALVFACRPLSSYWDSFSPGYSKHYHCVDTSVVNLLSGIFASTSDLYSVVLPCIMMYHHNIAKAQRKSLIALFCLGLVIPVASGVRTWYLIRIEHASDFTWQIFNVLVWGQIETNIQIICACLPTVRAMYRVYVKGPVTHIVNSTRGSNTARRLSSANSFHGSTTNMVDDSVGSSQDTKHSIKRLQEFTVEVDQASWADDFHKR